MEDTQKTHRGGVFSLEQWSLAGTVPEKLRSQVTPGAGRSVGTQQTLIQIVLGLVRELGCVRSHVLVKNGWPLQ